jgi:hypothetical protein
VLNPELAKHPATRTSRLCGWEPLRIRIRIRIDAALCIVCVVHLWHFLSPQTLGVPMRSFLPDGDLRRVHVGCGINLLWQRLYIHIEPLLHLSRQCTPCSAPFPARGKPCTMSETVSEGRPCALTKTKVSHTDRSDVTVVHIGIGCLPQRMLVSRVH